MVAPRLLLLICCCYAKFSYYCYYALEAFKTCREIPPNKLEEAPVAILALAAYKLLFGMIDCYEGVVEPPPIAMVLFWW